MSPRVARALGLITRHVSDRPAHEDATSTVPARAVRILAEPPAKAPKHLRLIDGHQATVDR